MVLVRVLGEVAVVVLAMLAVAGFALVGRERLARLPETAPDRFRVVGPYIAVLAVLLVLNSLVRDFGPAFSWIVGVNLTGAVHVLEGEFVARFQSALAHPALTVYFSLVYVYGYVFLLVFPLVAYFALDDSRPLRETIVAYSVNYGVGVVCYVLVIAYGPRNFMPELVDSLLYTTYPDFQVLTSEVNSNTNVFPSLHTSLALTVGLLSLRTRDVYPRWAYLAGVLGVSVAVSTMYLGIHWLVDVVAGGVLAVASVRAADRYVDD